MVILWIKQVLSNSNFNHTSPLSGSANDQVDRSLSTACAALYRFSLSFLVFCWVTVTGVISPVTAASSESYKQGLLFCYTSHIQGWRVISPLVVTYIVVHTKSIQQSKRTVSRTNHSADCRKYTIVQRLTFILCCDWLGFWCNTNSLSNHNTVKLCHALDNTYCVNYSCCFIFLTQAGRGWQVLATIPDHTLKLLNILLTFLLILI